MPHRRTAQLLLPGITLTLLALTLATYRWQSDGFRLPSVHAAAQPANSGLSAVLAQMDAASKNFHSAEADVKREQFEKVVNDTTTENGTIYFQRTGSSIQMGAKSPNQVLEYKDGTLRIYSPGTNHVDEYSSANNQARVDTFITLGFGGSGSDLARAWAITDQGSEQIAGVKVEKLDLVSKDPGVRQNFPRITIWVDLTRDVSLKQEFFAPGGDTNTATYSNVRVDQPIKDLPAYAIKCKGKCT